MKHAESLLLSVPQIRMSVDTVNKNNFGTVKQELLAFVEQLDMAAADRRKIAIGITESRTPVKLQIMFYNNVLKYEKLGVCHV